MAEVREGMQPTENVAKNPDKVKTGVRDRVGELLDQFIAQNPNVREQARNMDRVHTALPEGRVKDAVGLAVDVVKVPQAAFANTLELIKTIPGVSFLSFIPEKIGVVWQKAAGFVAEKVVESGPVQAGVRTVDSIVDGILGERRPAPVKATLENSHQILVGMARPEMGKQERKSTNS